MRDAPFSELKAIASPPEETHVYNVADFSVMSDIVESLTQTVCERVEHLDKQIKGRIHSLICYGNKKKKGTSSGFSL